MKSITKFIGAISIAASMVFPAMAEVKIVMSNDNNAKGLKGQTFEFFAKQLEDRLGDKVNVSLHHSGSLFDQKTQLQGLQLGAINIISPTAGIYSPIAPKIGALLLPFLLSSPEAINAAIQDELVRSVFVPEMAAKNIVPIAVWMNGPRSFGHKGKQPALTPDAWKGLKIRVQSAPVFVNTMKAIGANVIGMSWSEVPTALQQGVIDAAEPTPNAWQGSGIYKMVDHIIENEYVYSFYIVGANKQWWDDIPAAEKVEIQAALDATTAWNWKTENEINQAAFKNIEAEGTPVHRLNAEQKKLWQDAVAPVWKSMGEDLVGAEVMTRLKEISDKYNN